MPIGNVSGYRRQGGRIILQTEEGEVTLRFMTEKIVNVFMAVEGSVQESRAVEGWVERDVALSVTGGEVITIRTKELTVEVASPFALTFRDTAGRVINQDDPERSISLEKPFGVYKRLDPEEHIYGLGEKTGFLEKTGEEWVMWNSDVPEPHVPSIKALYASIPFYIGLRRGVAYGIFFDHTGKSVFDLGKRLHHCCSFTAMSGNIDYYFIYGPEMKEVIRGYTELTGRMPRPPLWALGYHQCRWGYDSESKLTEIAETFRAKRIPCDALYLDIDYMDGYRVFTWDGERFPDPQTMMERLRGDGFKVVTIVDPGVKKDADNRVYRELRDRGYAVTDQDGLPFVGRVWPGQCVFPDFTDEPVRRWWGEQHRVLLEAGAAGIWNDMNEPAVFTEGEGEPDAYKTMPLSNRHKNDGRPARHAEMHNLYGLMMARATYDGMRGWGEERPFIVSRAGYAGIQRYAALWTGDNQSFWEHLAMALPMCMNIGLSGVPFVGTDVGGFSGDCTAELLSRWVQVGCFTPFFRNHSAWNTRPQEPWSFDAATEEINRKYIALRYRLLPYTYNLFIEAGETGIPVMRPLVLEYPDDSEVYPISDQFLFGPALLAAPVTGPGIRYRHVYLPEGCWVDYWTGERHQGKRHILCHAPLDTLPLFVKAGSMIPAYEPMQFTGEKRMENLLLEIYPGGGGESRYAWTEDDGATLAYERGEYNLTHFTLTETESRIHLRVEAVNGGYEAGVRRYILRFHGVHAEGVEVNGGGVLSGAEGVRVLVDDGLLTVQVARDVLREICIIKRK